MKFVTSNVEKYGHPLEVEINESNSNRNYPLGRYKGLFIGEVNLETGVESDVSKLLGCTLAELSKDSDAPLYKKKITRFNETNDKLVPYHLYFFVYENLDHPAYKKPITENYGPEDIVKVCLSYVVNEYDDKTFIDIVMDVKLGDYIDLANLTKEIDECPSSIPELMLLKETEYEDYDEDAPEEDQEDHILDEGFDSYDLSGEHFYVDSSYLNNYNLVSAKIIEIIKKDGENGESVKSETENDSVD